MSRTNLRAVGADDVPVKRRSYRKVATASARGDRVGELQAMRRVIARAIDDPDTPARDLAALTKRLADLGREVAELEALERASAVRAADDGGTDGAFRPEAI